MCLSAGNAGAPCWDLYRRRPACPGRGVFDGGVVHLLYSSAAVPREIEIGDTPGLDGCRFSDSIEEGPTVKAAARCLVRSRLVATEPQWPRMNSTFSRSLRTRHSPVIPKISLRALRLLRFRPSSLPRFAASDDGHFAPGELPTRSQGACHAAREITVAVPDTSTQMNQSASGEASCENYAKGGRLLSALERNRQRIVRPESLS